MSYSPTLPWTLESLDFSRIDVARVRHNEDLFFLLCSSSFVESGSDLYTQNLIDHFAGDQELQTWLSQHWEHEELQHGRALAAYVRRVWPEFDWDKGFHGVLEGIRCRVHVRAAGNQPGLELAARCVVETGTASLYRALNDITDEPVLKQLTSHIKSDEVRHFKHFYQHYRLVSANARVSVATRCSARSCGGSTRSRAKTATSHCAMCSTSATRSRPDNEAEFRRISDRAQGLLRRHIPAA